MVAMSVAILLGYRHGGPELDDGLGVLGATPLRLDERLATVLTLTGCARWESQINRGYETRTNQTGISPNERDLADAHIMSTLVTPEQFPFLHEAIQAGVFTSRDNPFEYGLSRLLDGVEHHIAAVAADPSRRAEEIPAVPAAAYPKEERVRNARQARREAENKLREAIKREDEAVGSAREKERKVKEKEARAAEKRAKLGV